MEGVAIPTGLSIAASYIFVGLILIVFAPGPWDLMGYGLTLGGCKIGYDATEEM